MNSTQLGLIRLEGRTDTYQPGTLPPPLYQTNPFLLQPEDENTGTIIHCLTAKEMPATAREMEIAAEASTGRRN